MWLLDDQLKTFRSVTKQFYVIEEFRVERWYHNTTEPLLSNHLNIHFYELISTLTNFYFPTGLIWNAFADKPSVIQNIFQSQYGAITKILMHHKVFQNDSVRISQNTVVLSSIICDYEISLGAIFTKEQ